MPHPSSSSVWTHIHWVDEWEEVTFLHLFTAKTSQPLVGEREGEGEEEGGRGG